MPVEKVTNSIAHIRERVFSLVSRKTLPNYDDFLSFCNEASTFLECESVYRSFNSANIPSGLLDFTVDFFKDLPAIIIPDVHARASIFFDVLDFFPPNSDKNVLSLLENNEILLICLGDLPHAEKRAKSRWKEAYADFRKFYYDDEDIDVFLKNEAMIAEMAENFSVWEIVFLLKIAFPHNFHVLKGNHDNVRNANFHIGKNAEFGNRSFKKFCEEGIMCSEFIRNEYDDLFLHCLACFEHALPICAMLPMAVLSHAEPRVSFSRKDLANSNQNDDFSYALTWTANDEAQENSVIQTIQKLYKRKEVQNVRWISGHRPVYEKFALRQNGLFIQIHNPDVEQIAFVSPNRVFDPKTDIFELASFESI